MCAGFLARELRGQVLRPMPAPWALDLLRAGMTVQEGGLVGIVDLLPGK